ncbi:AAC(3) family N-acetyltransferase [Candidatus Micrarchaeota archaeon]|nr:AAC(3) family N-acetyltransferase [Candidatus Micrarchaeota archaeon]
MSSSQEKNNYHYTRDELVGALEEVGLKKGDIVFSHVGMGFLGYPKEGRDIDTIFDVIHGSLREVVGEEGTLIVPTYTYSFCKGEPFDIQNSPSTVGVYTEKFRKLPEAKRSMDPIFSVAGIGPKTEELFKGLPPTCFGEDCIYDRLVKKGGHICNIGVGFRYATFIHHAEKMASVPYRADKDFTGEVIDGKKKHHITMTFYARTGVDDTSTYSDLSRLEKEARTRRMCKSKAVGRGEITNISCRDMRDLAIEMIKKQPYYLARAYQIQEAKMKELWDNKADDAWKTA